MVSEVKKQESEKWKMEQLVVLFLKLWENLLTYVKAYKAILRQYSASETHAVNSTHTHKHQRL